MKFVVLVGGALALSLLSVACGDVHSAGQDIVSPSATATPGAQARLVLLASSRTDQQLDVSVQLLDANGVGIPGVNVALSITGCTVTPALLKTDAAGTATATAVASGTVTLSATTGAVSNTITVLGGATPLSVSLNVQSVIVGNASALQATVSGQAIGGAFTYVWTFGDGTGVTTANNSSARTYAATGTYNAIVKVTDGSGRTATANAPAIVNDAPPPLPPASPAPASTLGATLGCTGNTHGVLPKSACNVTLTFGGAAVSSLDVTGVSWDWGDGTTADFVGVAPFSVQTHLYAQAGTYVVTASATATALKYGSTAAVASKSIVVP